MYQKRLIVININERKTIWLYLNAMASKKRPKKKIALLTLAGPVNSPTCSF